MQFTGYGFGVACQALTSWSMKETEVESMVNYQVNFELVFGFSVSSYHEKQFCLHENEYMKCLQEKQNEKGIISC